MLRIYTRTGDEGETGLFGGQRVRKDALRVEAYGTVDELNAIIGLARVASHTNREDANQIDTNREDANRQDTNRAKSEDLKASVDDIDSLLQTIQNDLFTLGADLATPEEKDTIKGRIRITRIAPPQILHLEQQIDRYEAELPPLTSFILPGGTPLAAHLHHARVVCRRAERRTVTLAQSDPESLYNSQQINPDALRYLNRLSDLLFVLARVANHRQQVPDVKWTP